MLCVMVREPGNDSASEFLMTIAARHEPAASVVQKYAEAAPVTPATTPSNESSTVLYSGST